MSSATNQFTVLTISQFDTHNIIHLSFTIAFAQMIIIILLLFETPFRNPLVLRLDQFKIGKPQLAVKSFGATVFAAMMYNIYSVFELRRRFVDAVDSSNHILLAYHMFVAYLMGNFFFLINCFTLIFICDLLDLV
ncbi:putative B-cell receptor-associated protein [Helianthus annuus]|nr:putative B-cell receptor-associated protein [Helianthus annuus]